MRVPNPTRLLLALSALAAVGVALTGAILLWRYREATLAAAADREEVLVTSRAYQLGEEIDALVREIGRLSRLAEVDLADGNLEPEKTVLRLARRDSAVLSVAIAILDERGELLWAEPRDARPAASGPALVALARRAGRPAIALGEWEVDVAAPVAGRGAMVGIVDGRGGRDLFGPALRRALRGRGAVTLVSDGPSGERTLAAVLAGAAPPPLRLGRPGQAWLADDRGRRWLVTEAAVGDTGVVLRLVLQAREVEGELSAPFRRLVALVAGVFLLAVAGGLGLARMVRRLERSDVELARAVHLAAMGQTAAGIAHEVKNALNGLSISLDLLAAGRADAATAAAVHRRARAEIGRLRDVAEDLTLFAATPRLSLAEVELGGLCREAAESAGELAEDRGVTVDLDLPAAPLPLRADRSKLLGAIVNLVRNGIEATGPGGHGEPLGAATPPGPRRVLLRARAAGGALEVEVADRGPGLDPAVRARLFEPFVTTKRTGTGLGLTIARRVVEAHGGRIEAADRPGGGTLFRLVLPAAEGGAGPGAAGDGGPAGAAGDGAIPREAPR